MNSLKLRAGFVGLGMIGGSIAKNIRRVHPESYICAYDVDQDALNMALKDGTLNECFDTLEGTFTNCDIIFLCAPVTVNIDNLKKLKPYLSSHCIVTDVGSVKTPMQEAVHELGLEGNFIGGHPMIGSEKTGYIHAKDHLIENAYYFITPSIYTQFQLIPLFSSYVQSLGALPVTLKPEEHDFITASISHVPHIIAAELVQLVSRADTNNGMLKQLAAGGFKDITRIASSSPVMWEQICMNNATNIKRLLHDMVDDLQDIIKHMDADDGQYVNEYFKTAGEYRSSIPEHAIGLFERIFKISVDIPDEPGTIAMVTTLLAIHSLSIKNIGIVHNREHAEGALEIIFYNEESCAKAVEVLTNRNYTVHYN